MSLVRVEWTETVAYAAELEIDGYDLDSPDVQQVDRALDDLSDEALEEARVDRIDREVHEQDVVRDGELVAVVRAAPVHADQWED